MKILNKPISDYDIVNKKYVDENAGGGDTLPIGAIVNYDGSTVPEGYEAVQNVWQNIPLQSGFTTPGLASSGELMYRKIGDIVYIKGSVKGFTAINQAFATLPEGYRPDTRIDCYGSYSGTKTANVIIGNNGVMTLVNNQEGTITSANWVTICTSFVVE